MRILFRTARAHLIWGCASHFGLRMHISFMTAHAHLILSCAFAFHCGVNAPLVILGTPYHTNQPSKFVQKIAKHALLKLLKSHLLACYPTHTPVKGVKFNYKHWTYSALDIFENQFFSCVFAEFGSKYAVTELFQLFWKTVAQNPD